MKKYLSLLCLIFVQFFLFGQDNRSFAEITDSILTEAKLIYTYDKAFKIAETRMDNERKWRKKQGEYLTYPKGDTLVTLVLLEDDPSKTIAEFKMVHPDDEPVVSVGNERLLTAQENKFLEVKHKIFADVQENYELNYPKDDQFFNPIFIPFQQKNDSTQLYKLYLLTESETPGVVPFGRDYLFYAKEDGKVFYYLQFNGYMPQIINQEMIDIQTIEVEYPPREPYITPSDIYHFLKYAVKYELNFLKVISTKYGIYFYYDFERDFMDVLMVEE